MCIRDRAYDGIAIIVNPENPVTDLSLEQIAKIYTGEITNWKEVGGNDAEIVLIGREAGSGTRDGFESITGTEETCKYRQELTSTGDVITTVSQNPDAIGYASLAALKDTVKAVSVDGVTASEATVKDGTYKVQRPVSYTHLDVYKRQDMRGITTRTRSLTASASKRQKNIRSKRSKKPWKHWKIRTLTASCSEQKAS